MKAYDSLGFFILGHAMAFLPAILPGAFPPGMFDGANTSALWLELMGVVNNLAGASILAPAIPRLVAQILAWRIPPATVTEPAPVLRPALPDYARAGVRRAERLAA